MHRCLWTCIEDDWPFLGGFDSISVHRRCISTDGIIESPSGRDGASVDTFLDADALGAFEAAVDDGLRWFHVADASRSAAFHDSLCAACTDRTCAIQGLSFPGIHLQVQTLYTIQNSFCIINRIHMVQRASPPVSVCRVFVFLYCT